MTVLLIAATLRMAVPYVLATTGGAFSVRVGITDLGCEGMMIWGAFFAVIGSSFFGSPRGVSLLHISQPPRPH